MIGSAKMVASEIEDQMKGKSLEQMGTEVCSPGGTTVKGIEALNNSEVRGALMSCIKEATKHAKELSAR